MRVVLMGGGMDSYAVALWLYSLDLPSTFLHVDYGQKSAAAELSAVKDQTKFLNSLGYKAELVTTKDEGLIYKLNPSGSYLFGDKTASPEIHGRNLVLFLKAVGLAGLNGQIFLGLDKPFDGGEPFLDCTVDYFKKSIKLVGRTDISVVAPFIEENKSEVVRWATELDSLFLDRTMSCWDAYVDKYLDIVECGVCKHCLTKKSLKEAGTAYV